jgi:hypothetical protein
MTPISVVCRLGLVAGFRSFGLASLLGLALASPAAAAEPGKPPSPENTGNPAKPEKPAKPGEASAVPVPNPKSPTNASGAASGGLPPKSPDGQSLFDGKTLTGWQETGFAGRGEVKVEGGRIVLESGFMTGITWTNDLPRVDYELTLEAMRVEGSDFFCGLTFPVEKDPCSFVVGGWGGGVVGLSSIDGEDAAHNETTQYMNFENGKWFKIRVKVTKAKIEAWIDSDKVVNVETKGRTFSIRAEMELSKPLGIATWSTAGAVRNIRLRRL